VATLNLPVRAIPQPKKLHRAQTVAAIERERKMATQEGEEVTPTERQQSLAAARRACEQLKEYAELLSGVSLWDKVGHLITGFQMLDAKEQKQIAAGAKGAEYGKLGAKHGKKGGRPRKTNGGKK